MNRFSPPFQFEEQQYSITSVGEPVEVAEGVTCYSYKIGEREDCDLGVVFMEAGASTPLQLVKSGDRTIERHFWGKGKLIINEGKEVECIYEVEGKAPCGVEVEITVGKTMQWIADPDGPGLVFCEICFPPYEEGRFMNLPQSLVLSGER